MAKKLSITRTVALAIFAHCSWKSADKWSNERMATKLTDVKSVLPEGEAPEEIKSDLIEVIATIDDGGEFEVTDDETSKAPAATEKAAKEKKPKAEKAPKAEKPPKEPKVKQPKKGRPYFAAVALREAGGPASEINEALIARVDELTEKPNAKESKAWLLIAAQVISGWEAAPGSENVETPSTETAAA